MQLKIFIRQRIELIHNTGKELSYDVDETKIIDEGSEEFQSLIDACDFDETMSREQKVNSVIKQVKDICKYNTMEGIAKVKEAIKQVYLEDTNGYVEMSGIMMNPREFSLIRIANYSLNVEVVE